MLIFMIKLRGKFMYCKMGDKFIEIKYKNVEYFPDKSRDKLIILK